MRVGSIGQFVDGGPTAVAEFFQNENLCAAEPDAFLGLAVEKPQGADDAANAVEHEPGIVIECMGSHIIHCTGKAVRGQGGPVRGFMVPGHFEIRRFPDLAAVRSTTGFPKPAQPAVLRTAANYSTAGFTPSRLGRDEQRERRWNLDLTNLPKTGLLEPAGHFLERERIALIGVDEHVDRE